MAYNRSMAKEQQDPRSWWLAFGVLFGLGAAGLILIIASPRRGKPIELKEAPTPGPLEVYVSGAVRNPGLYELARGSRAQDALDAAGGPSAEADLDEVNLARELVDGEQVHFPEEGEREDTSFPININTASASALTELPGIGPATAQAIVDYRDANGSFASIEEIQNVSGIGAATFETIKDLITTG